MNPPGTAAGLRRITALPPTFIYLSLEKRRETRNMDVSCRGGLSLRGQTQSLPLARTPKEGTAFLFPR
jgi:hypothetical protein